MAANDHPRTTSYRSAHGTANTTNRDYAVKTGVHTVASNETTNKVAMEVKASKHREAVEAFFRDLIENGSNSLLIKFRGVGRILNDDH